MGQAKELSGAIFEAEVLKAKTPVLVDFWASWCGPCQMMAPIIEELAEDKDLQGKITIAKLNIDEEENQAIASEYAVMSIPNLKIFKEGEIIADFVGAQPKEVLKSNILNALKE